MTNIKLIVNGAKARAEVDGILTSSSIGIPVAIQYDSTWDGLTKNLVCTSGKWGPTGKPRTILNIESSAAVAHEVMIADNHLYIGVEGRSADGALVICTVWADCGTIFPGANANADHTAKPSLPVWAQMQAQIDKMQKNLSDSLQNVGLNTAQVNALDGMFKVCVFGSDAVAAYAAFATAFGVTDSSDSDGNAGSTGDDSESGEENYTTYSVTNNLTNVTNSNSATTATGYYSATLSIGSDYEYTELSITMGGADITDSVYGDGSILITEVTGDIVITASAQLIGLYPVYQLAESTTFDGSNTVDTGYALFDKGDAKDWTLLLDFTSSVRPGRVITCGTSAVFSMASESYYWFVYYGSNKWNKISNAADGVKLAVTHTAGSKALTFYYLDSDALASDTMTGQNSAATVLTTTCVLGGIPDGKTTGFTGTVDTCEIYERILSADEISEFMEVA